MQSPDSRAPHPVQSEQPSAWGLAVTFAGLVVLLALPYAVWWRTEQYHRRIVEDTDPAQQVIATALLTADRARSAAFYYLFTLDPAYAQEYHELAREWRTVAADDAAIRRCGPSVTGDWRAGTHALGQWFDGYGERYVRTGEQQDLERADTLFRVGEARLRAAGDLTDRLSARWREKANGASLAEATGAALMAAICLAIAALAWRDARTRTVLWRRERDSAARLQTAVTETNHRVKNNLQVVAALLEMRVAEHQAAVPVDELHDVVRQVRAVAAVHDFLSQELRSDTVPAAQVLERLVGLTAGTTGIDARVVAAAGVLSVKQATAVALIANELLLNAGKHGANSASVSMDATYTTAKLRVADDGPGFGPGFEPEADSNVGLALVRTLAQHDLGGTVSFSTERGAVVDVTFPLAADPPVPAESAAALL